jgi:hypothetical protein
VLEARVEGKAIVSRPAETVGSPRIAGEKRPADPFADDRTRDIDDLTSQIESGLADAMRLLERELLDHVEGKAFRPNNLRSRLRNSQAWKTFSGRVEDVLMEAARSAASRAVMQSGRVPEEDLDYDAIAKSVVLRPEGLRAIVRHTKERLLKRVSDKLEAKAEQSAIEAEVRAFIQEYVASEGHASVIAISEAVEAYNEGTLSVAEALGIDTVVVVEEDDAPDEPCIEASGQEWDLETARARRKEHPNCRRAFLLPEPAVA